MAKAKKNKKTKVPKWNSVKIDESAKEFDYFLMTKDKVSAGEIISHLKENNFKGLDVWIAMGVFSIEASQGHSVDFEEIEVSETFVDTSDLSFLKNREIQSVFRFASTEENLEDLKPYFAAITDAFGGFICMDSEDFQPMIEL